MARPYAAYRAAVDGERWTIASWWRRTGRPRGWPRSGWGGGRRAGAGGGRRGPLWVGGEDAGPWSRRLWGSPAEAASRRSPASVVVVPGECGQLRSLLVAYDGGRSEER